MFYYYIWPKRNKNDENIIMDVKLYLIESFFEVWSVILSPKMNNLAYSVKLFI